MKTAFHVLLSLMLGMVLSSCSDADPALDAPVERLPHVLAPVDTTAAGGEHAVAPGSEGMAADSLELRWQAKPPTPYLPVPEALAFVTYRNDAFDYSIAYPDTLMKPRSDIGVNRGREFAADVGDAVALVYAVEKSTLQQFDEQLADYTSDPAVTITYRVREDGWYVVAGYRGRFKFYDKTLLRGNTLKTFQIQYDTTHAAYFDAVAATMAVSFKG